MIEIILGVGFFTGIVLILAVLILSARSKLVASGHVTITINDKKSIETPIGGKLLGALGDAKILLALPAGAAVRVVCAESRSSKGWGHSAD